MYLATMSHKLGLAAGLLFLAFGYVLAVTRQEIYDFIKSDQYDANEPPPPADKSTEVKIGLYVNSLAIDRQNQKIVWTMYLRQAWNDSRLQSMLKKDEQITMGQGHWKEVWYPDLFFRNSLEVVHESMPAEQALMRISQKHIWFVHKLKVSTTCYGLHNIGKKKSCPLMFESFKYTTDHLYFSWLSSPVDLDYAIQLPYHTVTEKILYDCSQNYTAGTFPCLEIRLILEDDASSSVVTGPRLAFAIGVFLVIISWCSFWIDGDRIVERLGLLLGVLIAIMLLAIGLHVKDDLDLPTNANFVFTGAFAFFVIAAMLEYITVYGATNWIPAKLSGTKKGELQENSSHGNLARIIDIACGLVVFPALFVLFIIIYLAMGF